MRDAGNIEPYLFTTVQVRDCVGKVKVAEYEYCRASASHPNSVLPKRLCTLSTCIGTGFGGEPGPAISDPYCVSSSNCSIPRVNHGSLTGLCTKFH